MSEFCRCGKAVFKGGRCNNCYMRDYYHHQKRKSEIKNNDFMAEPFEEMLKSELIPLFNQNTDEKITEWTEKNVFLPPGEGAYSAKNPDWSLAPEMDFIFEQVKNPDVKEIYLMFSSQSSKTLFQFCLNAWFIAVRKINGLFVAPSERLTDRIKTRMEKIFNSSPILGYEEKKGGKNTLSFGTNHINIGLATSPDSLAEMPADFVDFDELDEVKPQDINPVQLARSRGRTKPNFKMILCSTPKKLEGHNGILDYYNQSKRFDIEMKCPHCEEYSIFDESTIMAPEGADHREIESKSLGFAVCPKCGCEIDDTQHEKMVMTQRWKDLDPHLPMTYIGFHKASWNTVFNDFSSIAAKRLKSKEEGPNSEKDFYNSECAQPIDLDSLGGDIEQTAIALESYNRKEIPADVTVLTIGADVGVYEVHCVVIGWAPGNKKYQIFEQVISWDNQDFDKVERGLMHLQNDIASDFKYLGTGTRPMFVGGAIDSGYRPNLIYEFCRKHPQWIPIKGRNPMTKPWVITPADAQRRYGKAAAGVNLYTINQFYWQDVFQTALERPLNTDGSFNLPFDFHPRYLDQINSEVKKLKVNSSGVQVEVWEKKSRSAQNHFRDATIYGVMRGYSLDIDKMKKFEAMAKPQEKKTIPKFGGAIRGRNRASLGGRR